MPETIDELTLGAAILLAAALVYKYTVSTISFLLMIAASYITGKIASKLLIKYREHYL